MGVVVGIDEVVVVVEGGRALVAGGSVDGCIVGLAAVGRVKKWHHFFRLGALIVHSRET
jgi:hypothetical protein